MICVYLESVNIVCIRGATVESEGVAIWSSPTRIDMLDKRKELYIGEKWSGERELLRGHETRFACCFYPISRFYIISCFHYGNHMYNNM